MPELRDTRPSRRKRLVKFGLLAVVLGLLGIAAGGVLSGRYQVRPVLSGSMRPGFAVGGVVITKRVPISTLQVRDVVVFHRPDQPQELVVHRIISLTKGAGGVTVQTQGDANDAPDPWKISLHGTTAYRAVYSVPLVGYAAVWMHNPNGRRTLLFVGLLLVIGAAATTLVNRRRTKRDAVPSEDDPTAATDEADADATTEAEPSLEVEPAR